MGWAEHSSDSAGVLRGRLLIELFAFCAESKITFTQRNLILSHNIAKAAVYEIAKSVIMQA